jgi:deoxycytidylate deaminase
MIRGGVGGTREELLMNDKWEKWDQRFMDLAAHVSTWSKDPSTKVGSVIVRLDRTVVSRG